MAADLKLLPLPPSTQPRLRLSPVIAPEIEQSDAVREVRELTLAEVNNQVSKVFTENDAVVPDPRVSTVVGVVEDGEVVAFLTLQLCLHADPVWTRPGRSDLFQALVRVAEETVAQKVGGAVVFLLAEEGSRVERLAGALGFEKGLRAMHKFVAPATVPVTTVPPDDEDDDGDDDPDDRPFTRADFEGIV